MIDHSVHCFIHLFDAYIGQIFWIFWQYAMVIFVVNSMTRNALLTFASVRACYRKCTKRRIKPGLFATFFSRFLLTHLCLLCVEGGDPSLDEILSTDLGYAYFHQHLRQEYCEENLMCVRVSCVCRVLPLCVWSQAIDRFKQHPTMSALFDIVQRFLQRGAPLEVNMFHETRCAFVLLVCVVMLFPAVQRCGGQNRQHAE